MKKNDLVGLVQILDCNLADVPKKEDWSKEELAVFEMMKKLKDAIEKLK